MRQVHFNDPYYFDVLDAKMDDGVCEALVDKYHPQPEKHWMDAPPMPCYKCKKVPEMTDCEAEGIVCEEWNKWNDEWGFLFTEMYKGYGHHEVERDVNDIE